MSEEPQGVYMISVSSTISGVKGAVLVECDERPDVRTMRVDPDGEDIGRMGLHKFHTTEEMKALGY